MPALSLCDAVDLTKCCFFFGRKPILFDFVWEAANRGLPAPFVSGVFLIEHRGTGRGRGRGRKGCKRDLEDIGPSKTFCFAPRLVSFLLRLTLRRQNVAASRPSDSLPGRLFSLSQPVTMATAGDSVSNQTQLCEL